MYINHKPHKTVYQLYLRNKKAKVDHYLCSIARDEIEGANSEELGEIVIDIRDEIQRSIERISEDKRRLLASLGKDINMLVMDKLMKLAMVGRETEM